jgi:pimeloyl-ACP methyl ester carboxylesterase
MSGEQRRSPRRAFTGRPGPGRAAGNGRRIRQGRGRDIRWPRVSADRRHPTAPELTAPLPSSPDPTAFRGGGFEARALDLHGHRVIYRVAGTGPPVVLIHGMVNSSRHWKGVAEGLAEDYMVIAPDLLGHGDSAKPEGDYSLGAHAAGIRDLLAALGVNRASLVGHSLGGGIAMQFFYQFPERCERLILISSGGLGREVSLPIRLAAVPGTGAVLALAANPRTVAAIDTAGSAVGKLAPGVGVLLHAIARTLRLLEEPGARRAFLQTLRSVIGISGQRVSARDRLYLAAALPTLIVWGEDDRTIPLAHGRAAHGAITGSQFETIPGVAHFPNLEKHEALARILREFMQTTEPARLDPSGWRGLLETRPGHQAEGV